MDKLNYCKKCILPNTRPNISYNLKTGLCSVCTQITKPDKINWKKRKRIVNKLYDNGLNSYLYCPKEDPYHRSRWRKDYPKTWYKNFKNLRLGGLKISEIINEYKFKYKDFESILPLHESKVENFPIK